MGRPGPTVGRSGCQDLHTAEAGGSHGPPGPHYVQVWVPEPAHSWLGRLTWAARAPLCAGLGAGPCTLLRPEDHMGRSGPTMCRSGLRA